ncbi:hypothetical protein ACFL0D_03900 [Thermoproteota archaeon]
MNRPKKSFDPSTIDLDLKERTQIGLGRKNGFTYEDNSILGDDEYSPLFAQRALDVLKMFLD